MRCIHSSCGLKITTFYWGEKESRIHLYNMLQHIQKKKRLPMFDIKLDKTFYKQIVLYYILASLNDDEYTLNQVGVLVYNNNDQ